MTPISESPTTESPTTSVSSASNQPSNTPTGSKRKNQSQSLIEPIKTSKDYREACATQLAKFFYSARIPFLVCENEEFKIV